MRHHTPYPAMEVKRSENIRLVGIEAELADGEKPIEYRSVLILLHARVVNGNRSMPPGPDHLPVCKDS
jgi:hypothetical protein